MELTATCNSQLRKSTKCYMEFTESFRGKLWSLLLTVYQHRHTHTLICRCLWCRRSVRPADLPSPSSYSSPSSSVSPVAGRTSSLVRELDGWHGTPAVMSRWCRDHRAPVDSRQHETDDRGHTTDLHINHSSSIHTYIKIQKLFHGSLSPLLPEKFIIIFLFVLHVCIFCNVCGISIDCVFFLVYISSCSGDCNTQ